MRLGLIADIHGNCVALDAVLAALARAGVEQCVCLGDVAALGPQPRECVARLRELGCPCVLGNTDDWLGQAPSLAGIETSPPVAALTRWAATQFTPDDLAWIASWPLALDVSLSGGRTLRCFHGSPHSHEDVISATTPDAELEELLDGAATHYAGGHTHVQLARRYCAGLIANPGSVGLPGVGPGTPGLLSNQDVAWAEYAILNDSAAGTSLELHRLPLDVAELRHVARESGMPEYEWWSARWRGEGGIIS